MDAGVFEVLATAGDTHLGGEDFDNRLIEHLLALFRKRNPGAEPSASASAMQRLRREAERAKRALSTQAEARVEIESLLPGYNLSERISRAKFEELCADLFRQTLLPVERVLDDAGVRKSEVDEVVLVGGSTRIPKVRALLSRFFGGKQPTTSVDPDEAVAYGAAVQAGVLSGERDKKITDLLLLDVTPLTLGIETVGGVLAPIIPRNSVIPTSKSKVYTTSEDDQVAVTNKVFEGERPLSKDNRLLGSFELSGFPAMRKGEAQIDVRFDVDANGILSVSATELTSSTAARITIENTERLDATQVEQMVRDAEAFRAADEAALARVRAQTALESYVYSVRSRLKDVDLRGRMEVDDVEAIQAELVDTDEWVDANAAGDGGATVEELEQRLRDLRELVVEPILERYGAGETDWAPAGGHSWDEGDVMGEPGDGHDEL